MRKWFNIDGKRFHVFADSDYKYIAMDSNEDVFIYTKRPQRNTCDDDVMWHVADDDRGVNLEQVYVSQNAERAMKKVGWRRSLRKLRCC